MNASNAITQLREGKKPEWPSNAFTLDFAESLDKSSDIPKSFRDEFVVPRRAQVYRTTLEDKEKTSVPASSITDQEAIYFCGNSLGLQPKATRQYMDAYLKTWSNIVVGSHFTKFEDSPLPAFQDMAAECSEKMAKIVGASASEVVAMNTLTINLHLMMAAFYKPSGKKNKIMCEYRPFPSDWYAIESQIEWHGLVPKDAMLPVDPHNDEFLLNTEDICKRITDHADELALILLPGIQYYSGQLLDIPTITAHARKHGITIGWDLAHAAGNVELKLHEWDVDFACWCTYKYINAGAGAIAGAFVHSKHGNNGTDIKGLRGWYGHHKDSRFKMDNKYEPTPGAQGFQCSNPSAVDLTCLLGALSVYDKTTMTDLRSRSLLLTAYAEHLLNNVAARNPRDGEPAFRIITPEDPLARGTQLSVLFKETKDLKAVIASNKENGVVMDKREPNCIRVAPVPLYNTFGDIYRFMEMLQRALQFPVEL